MEKTPHAIWNGCTSWDLSQFIQEVKSDTVKRYHVRDLS